MNKDIISIRGNYYCKDFTPLSHRDRVWSDYIDNVLGFRFILRRE